MSANNMKKLDLTCWVCKSGNMTLFKPNNIKETLNSNSFSITDSNYGITGQLHQCANCGFIQCSDLHDFAAYYREMEDEEYELGRKVRGIQAHKLLELLHLFQKRGRLLDIGAGTGILLEQALSMGYEAEGVEPSQWSQKKALEYGLNVHLGIYPHPSITNNFDLVTIVDVIEHVPNPVELLINIAAQLDEKGFGLVVTPDRGALIPRIMGLRWWHYRIAHIGYFTRNNFLLALDRAGLEPVKIGRPNWYFSAGYLLERLYQYLPRYIRIPFPKSLFKITIPLNLGDSLYIVFKKKVV